MATNPATQPGAEAVEGDNLTAPQAKGILELISAEPDSALAAFDTVFEEAGYPDAETMLDETVTYLSSAAGAPDTEDEADAETEEADPAEMEAT